MKFLTQTRLTAYTIFLTCLALIIYSPCVAYYLTGDINDMIKVISIAFMISTLASVILYFKNMILEEQIKLKEIAQNERI